MFRDKIESDCIVIQDNLTLPWLDRSLCSRKSIAQAKTSNYPGSVFALTTGELTLLREALENIFSVKLNPLNFQARLRLTTKRDEAKHKTFIHADPFDLTGIIYLSPCPLDLDPHRISTRFYQHKVSGIKKFSTDNSRDLIMAKMIVMNFTNVPLAWDEWIKVEYKLDRAIFFNGKLLHSGPDVYFGDNELNGRLTLDFFTDFCN